MAEDTGNGTGEGTGEGDKNGTGDVTTPFWQELGYKDNGEVVDEFLRVKKNNETLEAENVGLKTTRDKQAADYRKQSTDVGDLRKENETLQVFKRDAESGGLRKSEEQNPSNQGDEQKKTPDEVLADLGDVEVKGMNEFLDKPENASTKQKVVAGGKAAMAEFAQAYKQEAPPDLTKPVFQVSGTESASHDESSISGMVRKAFRGMEDDNKKQVPAGTQGSMSAGENNGNTQEQRGANNTGTVDANFFRQK